MYVPQLVTVESIIVSGKFELGWSIDMAIIEKVQVRGGLGEVYMKTMLTQAVCRHRLAKSLTTAKGLIPMP